MDFGTGTFTKSIAKYAVTWESLGIPFPYLRPKVRVSAPYGSMTLPRLVAAWPTGLLRERRLG